MVWAGENSVSPFVPLVHQYPRRKFYRLFEPIQPRRCFGNNNQKYWGNRDERWERLKIRMLPKKGELPKIQPSILSLVILWSKIFSPSLPRSVVLSMHLGIFNEFSLLNFFFNSIYRRKMVMDSIFFSFPWGSSCVRHWKAKLVLRESFHEHFNQSSFTDTRGTAKDDRSKRFRITRCRICHDGDNDDNNKSNDDRQRATSVVDNVGSHPRDPRMANRLLSGIWNQTKPSSITSRLLWPTVERETVSSTGSCHASSFVGNTKLTRDSYTYLILFFSSPRVSQPPEHELTKA